MQVINIPLHQIKPYENNVKQHPVSQLEAIRKSIEDFDYLQPIVIDRNNVIVAGHGRYEAATALGKTTIPCVIMDQSDEKVTAYRMLDNEIAEQGYTDQARREIEIAKIPEFDFKPFNLEVSKPDIDIKEIKEVEHKTTECPACGHKW
jgi:ParB family chromosome partitioning protein